MSSNNATVTLPVSVTVTAGQTSASFSASVAAVDTSQSAVISGATNSTALMFTLELAPALQIDTVANSASYSTDLVCSAGSLASIFGSGFTSSVDEHATTMSLPRKLADVSLEVNGHAAGLLYVSDQLINFQCPSVDQASPVTVVVNGANGETASVKLNWAEASPGIFSTDGTGKGQGVVLVAGTAMIAGPSGPRSRQAHPGEYIEIFATGLGPRHLPRGRRGGAPLTTLIQAALPVSLTIGGKKLEPTFAGYAPGYDGLWQINVQLPTDIATGLAIPLQVSVTLSDGTVVTSNVVTIAIDSAG
jgi:uncharacterized protein (TIGR03437 family)